MTNRLVKNGIWGICLFTLLAVSANAQKKDILKLPEPEKRFAILVGVDGYNDQDKHFQNLDGPANDVESTRRALLQYAGFRNDNVYVLSDTKHASASPSRENVIAALYLMKQRASKDPKNSLLVFMFTGHGISIDENSFLVPQSDYYFIDDQFMQQSYLSVADISKDIQDTGIGKVILFIDACRNNSPGIKGQEKSAYKPLNNKFYFNLRNNLPVPQAAVFYATKLGDYSFNHQNNGYFSEALVEGLRGSAADSSGNVTISALSKYLNETVSSRVFHDWKLDQTPTADIGTNYDAEHSILVSKKDWHHPTLSITPNPPILRTRELSAAIELLSKDDEILKISQLAIRRCSEFEDHSTRRYHMSIPLMEDYQKLDLAKRELAAASEADKNRYQRTFDGLNVKFEKGKKQFDDGEVQKWNSLYQTDFANAFRRLDEAVPQPPSGDVRDNFRPTPPPTYQYIKWGCMLLKQLTDRYAAQLLDGDIQYPSPRP